MRMATEKAMASVINDDQLIIASDTSVVIDERILGKPKDKNDARNMLESLSGRKHFVLSAIALRGEKLVSDICSTEVAFREMTESEIEWYISTGEPMDKAGAYGIQGFASLFIDGIQGSYSNVVGMPIQMLEKLFRRLNLDLIDFVRTNS